VKVAIVVPGGPIQDNLVEVGGPTAQATLDSLGNSKGYAAFPDPGSLVVSIPGMMAGLLAGGAGPIPPIEVPTLPAYPFAISSDAAVQPEASGGEGPYVLRTTSTTSGSNANSSAGLQLGGVANTALARSWASVERSDTEVVVTGTTQIEGVTLGPLTLGQIRSTAMLAMDATGYITPSTTMAISGARIGGVAIDLEPTGLNLGGPTVPLPIASVSKTLLAASGIKLEIEPGEVLEDGITSPAIRLSTQFDASGIGKGPGTASMVLGDVAVHLGAPSGGPVESDTGGAVDAGGSPVVDPGAPSTDALEFGAPEIAEAPSAPGRAAETGAPPVPIVSRLAFDVSGVYLGLLLLGGLLLLVNQFLRLLGVRSP
jgi:hypothetical protein